MNSKRTNKTAPESELPPKARILKAARILFAQKGFKGSTTRAIAAEAGVNEVTIFRIWGSKEKILYEVLASSFPSAEDAPLVRILEREVSGVEDLEALLEAFILAFRDGILASLRDVIMIGIKEANDRPEFQALLRDKAAAVAELLERRLRRLEEAGLATPGGAAAAAAFVVSALIGSFILAEGASTESAPPEGAGLARLVARGLASVP